MDGRFMIVCFEEPIFDVDVLQDYMSGGSGTKAGYVEPATVEAETSAAASSAPPFSSSKLLYFIFLGLASVSLCSLQKILPFSTYDEHQ